MRRLVDRIVVLLVAVATTTGCATSSSMTTRTGTFGVLPHNERLVTLVVTQDPAVVRGECPFGLVTTNMLGCQTSRELSLGDDRPVRVVKIVRFADQLPSALTFEIDIHELCHTVAALQGIADPCHIGNGGVVQNYPSAAPRGLLR